MTKYQRLAALEQGLQACFDRVMSKRRFQGKDARRAVMLRQGIHRLQSLHPFGPRRLPLPY